MDNRSVIHTAGPYDGRTQRCLHCKAIVSSRIWDDGNPWREGAEIVNHGHGGWSVIEGIAIDHAKVRYCKARGAAHA